MARRKKQTEKRDEDTLVDIVEVKDSAQSFLDKNQGLIFGALVGLVVIIGGIFAYNNFYKGPRVQEAANQLYQAQLQFEKDSFALALTNPGGGFSGFEDIIGNYSGTPAANSAKYYAGISYLHLGNYDQAISYLNSFSPAGDLLPAMKYGALGDAYSEKNQMDDALSNYQRAVSSSDNGMLSAYYLKKIGLFHEKNQDFAKAQEAYKRIKTEFPNSPVGSDIDKFLARVNAK